MSHTRAMTPNTQAGSAVVEWMLWTTAPFCSDNEASSFCRYLLPLSLSYCTLSFAVYFERIIQQSFTSLIIYSVSFCHSAGFSRCWVEESSTLRSSVRKVSASHQRSLNPHSPSHADLGKHYFLCLLICLVRAVHMNTIIWIQFYNTHFCV